MKDLKQKMTTHCVDAFYSNYDIKELDADAVVRMAYGGHYERLSKIKHKYDPNNLFRATLNVKPSTHH